MHLKIGRSAGNSAYVQMGISSRVMVASRPKVSFWPDSSTSPRNYGWLFVGILSKQYLNAFPFVYLFLISWQPFF
jgi:hypothetical protein